MKYAIAFLLLASPAIAQNVHIDISQSKTQRIPFDPYKNQTRTIYFDLSTGHPVVTSDVTVPEGVGYIYISNGKTAVLEYSRTEDVRMIRFWQQMPFAPIQPFVGF